MKTPHPQYIYNEKGKPLMVVLPVKEYEALRKKQEKPQPEMTPFMLDIKEGFDYIRAVKAGKIKPKTAQEMLAEWDGELNAD
jgi:hypothetical protein